MTIWIGCVLTLLAIPAPVQDHSTFQRDSSRAGATDELTPPPAASFTTAWPPIALGIRGHKASPTIADYRLFLGSEDGRMRAYDLATGAPLWTFPPIGNVGPIRGAATHWRGRLFFGSLDGHLYCLRADTGDLVWDIFHGGNQLSTPAIVPSGSQTLVVFGPGDPWTDVRAYDAITQDFAWSVNLGQPVTTSPAYHDGGGVSAPKIIACSNNGYWAAIDAANGGPPLWTWQSPNLGQPVTSAAVWGDYVLLCSGLKDRYLHTIDAHTGAPLKQVFVAPPGAVKPGGGSVTEVENPVIPYLPEDQVYEMLLWPKADRDVFLAQLGAEEGVDYGPLGAILDDMTQPGGAGLNKSYAPGATFVINPGKDVETSSLAVAVDLGTGTPVAVISHRECTTVDTGEFFTVGINPDPAVPENVSRLWAWCETSLSIPNLNMLPSPAISKGQYVFFANAHRFYARNLLGTATEAPLAEYDVTGQVTGSPAVASGYVVIATDQGEVIALRTTNDPPTGPTSFSLTGGVNVISTYAPTVLWNGQGDDATPGSLLVCEIEWAKGWQNANLAMSLSTTGAVLAPGVNAYAFPEQPANTHVYYRVRARDGHGAWSRWSAVQDFWIHKDIYPPDPPTNVAASPYDASVIVTWTSSPSPDVERYRLRHKLAGQAWSAALVIDPIGPTATSQWVTALTNGQGYEFMLSAVDFSENESVGVVVSAVAGVPSPTGGGPPPTGGTPSIQDWIDVASPGQTIHVPAGTFLESLVLPAGVSLTGAGPGLTFLVGPGGPAVIQITGSSAYPTTITGLNVNGGSTGIDAGNAEVRIDHVVVHGVDGAGIRAAAQAILEIVNVTIMDNNGDGIESASSVATIVNSIVAMNQGVGIDVPAAAIVEYNDAYYNLGGEWARAPLGLGNVSTAGAWREDPPEPEYYEAEGSAAVDAGAPPEHPFGDYANEPSPNGGRVNLGAYGNTSQAARSTQVAEVPPPGGDGGGDVPEDGGGSGETAGTQSPGGGGGGGGGGCAAGGSTQGFGGVAVLAVLAALAAVSVLVAPRA